MILGLSRYVHGIGQFAHCSDQWRHLILLSRYDFDLKTGHSETGLKACTYATDVRKSDEGAEYIYVETPEGGSNWRLVEFRPVSEGE